MRHAMRGVDTVIHLAASIRDQPRGTIEELNGLATLRLLRSAERVGVNRFVFFTAMNATPVPAHAVLPLQGDRRARGRRVAAAHDRVRAFDRLPAG